MYRQDFPILDKTIYGKYPLVYLDNGATTQKPRCVVEAMSHEYYNVNANVHRGVHFLSQAATDLHEASRETVRQFIGAANTSEIIFTRGTTESINLVASCFTQAFMKEGDEVILSQMEHHSNIVSWQLAQARCGIRIRVIPMTDDGRLCMDEYERLFNERTRLVSVTHVSNVMGTINPVKDIIRIAHEHDVPVLIDGAQSTPHFAVNVSELDCDFFAFSSHKTYGPTGIGVLYGKEKWLDRMPPYMGGGDMIKTVSFEKTTFNDLPYKFEAGTPNYVGSHAFGKAIDYLQAIGLELIATHEHALAEYMEQQLSQISQVHVYAAGQKKAGAVSFNIYRADGTLIHPFDVGVLLDRQGVAVRTGHHCAEPLIDYLQVPGTVRASVGLYNTQEDIDAFIAALKKAIMMLE